jgi:hypothetical protein
VPSLSVRPGTAECVIGRKRGDLLSPSLSFSWHRRTVGSVAPCLETVQRGPASRSSRRPGAEVRSRFIVATNLDRLGRNLRECLNVVHELREQGIGIKTFNDPIPIDTTDDSPMAELAVATRRQVRHTADRRWCGCSSRLTVFFSSGRPMAIDGAFLVDMLGAE